MGRLGVPDHARLPLVHDRWKQRLTRGETTVPGCLGDNSDGSAQRIRCRGQGLFRFHRQIPPVHLSTSPRAELPTANNMDIQPDSPMWAVLAVPVYAQPRCFPPAIRQSRDGESPVSRVLRLVKVVAVPRMTGGCSAKGQRQKGRPGAPETIRAATAQS